MGALVTPGLSATPYLTGLGKVPVTRVRHTLPILPRARRGEDLVSPRLSPTQDSFSQLCIPVRHQRQGRGCIDDEVQHQKAADGERFWTQQDALNTP